PDATTSTRIVTALLTVARSATTFFTQRQLTRKNMPESALQGPMAQQQKILPYALPLIFAVTGVNFPIGVLVYWTTTNLWSMGQQFYTIRRMPAPGSEAERQLKERQARKRAATGIVEDATPVIEQPRGQRQQPKRKDRQKGTPRPAASSPAAHGDDAPVEDAPVEDAAPGSTGPSSGAPASGGSKPAPKKKKQK